MGRCVLTYLLIHGAAWLAISWTVPWEDESFPEIMALGAGMLLIIGVPTLLISVCAVSVHRRMDVARFRVLLGMALAPGVWPLIACGTGEPLVFQVTAQIAFAALIPAPLLPEDWEGEVG
ncbi:hypothetical protein A8W25_30450 [Streptomyces sp. ERV7]|uniref:hypothetical protein n=1 Tax=Streptomyces sp. ERV7 TaxID=1322334 RepID=UPI0007F3EF9D|nr:hypothetical protein [Streptomyces sp. ERV7]OAR21966.1 hypothetical protein A8W25_30450 [Streptomyces sp. ERV7]